MIGLLHPRYPFLLERPDIGERAILVHIDIYQENEPEDLEELRALAISAGAEIVGQITGNRQTPEPKFFIGSGKAEEIRQLVIMTGAELVIVNHPLSPTQERNLEKEVKARVIPRTGLILDIFAQRARTFEGKLQVELAQLKHLATRLVRGWTHLERQKGGIGLRGPGETQLETDRRLIRKRIEVITDKLEKVRRQRAQGRRARERAAVLTVSLVGYTNAGKSTLFNQLTGDSVYAANQLFATLDPTLRRVELQGAGRVILVDTVGFIRHLPHDLVEAFRATLEETRLADLILHVIDASDPQRREKQEQVLSVLEEIGADQVPRLDIYNKIDRMSDQAAIYEPNPLNGPARLWLSSLTGEGTDLLGKAVCDVLGNMVVNTELRIPAQDGKVRAELYENDAVVKETVTEEGDWLIEVRLPTKQLERIFASLKTQWQNFEIDKGTKNELE
jgi:GTP-binding protein HflX